MAMVTMAIFVLSTAMAPSFELVVRHKRRYEPAMGRLPLKFKSWRGGFAAMRRLATR